MCCFKPLPWKDLLYALTAQTASLWSHVGKHWRNASSIIKWWMFWICLILSDNLLVTWLCTKEYSLSGPYRTGLRYQTEKLHCRQCAIFCWLESKFSDQRSETLKFLEFQRVYFWDILTFFRLTFLIVLCESFLQKGYAAFRSAFVAKDFGIFLEEKIISKSQEMLNKAWK